MGGCSPSKMPNADENGEQKSASHKFGFSSSRKSSRSNSSSLNASQLRIKTLADSEETYEIVKGGRKEDSEKSNGHVLPPPPVPPDLTRDAESQTMHSSNNQQKLAFMNGLESRLTRPSLLGPGSKPGFPRAPLAMSETASELGTPTPMDENKSFAKPYPSFLPQPGQQRPLQHPQSKLAFPPRIPTASTSSSASVPAAASAVSIAQSLPSTGHLSSFSRPKDPPPKPPGRGLVPPSSLPGHDRHGTDNVPIATSSGARFSSPKGSSSITPPKPGSRNGFQRLPSKESSGDSVRSPSVQEEKSSVDSPRTTAENASRFMQGDHNFASPTVLSSASEKFAASKSGIRMPVPPRGPLALQPQKHNAAHPIKPARKSPQPLPSLPTLSPSLLPGRDTIRHESVSDPVHLIPAGEDFSDGSSSSRSLKQPSFSPSGFAVFPDRDSYVDDLGGFIPGEGLADRSKEYLVGEFMLNEILYSLSDVKKLAQELLDSNDGDAAVLKGNHEVSRKPLSAKAQKNGVGLGGKELSRLLEPPTKELLGDPARTHKFILDLQAALRLSSSL